MARWAWLKLLKLLMAPSILPRHTARHFDMEPYTLAQIVQQNQARMDGSIAVDVVLIEWDGLEY